MKCIFRNSLITVVFCFLSGIAKAQYVTIPDSNFVNWLNNNGFAGCMSGNQMDTTCNAVISETEIHCSFSNITDLTGISFFDSLITLDCFYNQINFLPILPSRLTTLICPLNQLSSLPALPTSLLDLRCYDNLLVSLPELNNDMILFIDNNPNLKCFPYVKSVQSLSWNNTGINCFSNNFTVGFSAQPPINNVPICDFINSNNCPVYWNIKGSVFNDSNNNCFIDTGEIFYRNVKLNLIKNGTLIQQAFTNNIGQFSFDTDTGIYFCSIDTTFIPVNITCPLAGTNGSNITFANSFHGNENFALECKGGFDVGAYGIIGTSGMFIPAGNVTLSVLAGDLSNQYNLNCAAGVSGIVRVILSGPASISSIISGALTPAINGDTLIYSITDFGTVNFQNDFSFIIQIDTTAILGSQVCFDVTVFSTSGDNNLNNNYYNHCFEIFASFDPNEKEVSPVGIIDTSQYWLTYTIHFQNTGNAPAQNIYIIDTLDNNTDESSIQILTYSYEPKVQILGNAVRLLFSNINLPDSTNDEPNSHGFVQYRVKRRNNLAAGTQIKNTAYIYFDFNAPVVTNTTVNTLTIPSAVSEVNPDKTIFTIFPNPVSSPSTLNVFYNSTSAKGILRIYEMSGRMVYTTTLKSSNQSQQITLPDLSNGIYQCTIESESGVSSQKLVIVN